MAWSFLKSAVAAAGSVVEHIKDKVASEDEEFRLARYGRFESQLQLQAALKLPPLGPSALREVPYVEDVPAPDADAAGPELNENGVDCSRANLHQSPEGRRSWTNLPGYMFNVRQGPQYHITGDRPLSANWRALACCPVSPDRATGRP